MTKIALFLPTNRKGGLDVFEGSIRRQIVQPDIIFVSDEHNRESSFKAISETLGIEIHMLNTPWIVGNKRNLAASYNIAAKWASVKGADLFISLQDYIWIPKDGIDRFKRIYEANSSCLITGLTDISVDPTPEEIVDIEASYSIFKNPYYDRPKWTDWHDVRKTIYRMIDDTVFPVSPEHWEANWAAVPVSIFDKAIKWDERFDKGIAYENMDFAQRCAKAGYKTVIDMGNQAVSLNHKSYWPEEVDDISKFSNRSLYEGKWL